jgi:hypothetical protein
MDDCNEAYWVHFAQRLNWLRREIYQNGIVFNMTRDKDFMK